LQAQFPTKRQVGALLLPGTSLVGVSLQPALDDPTCTVFSLPEEEDFSRTTQNLGTIGLVLCQLNVPLSCLYKFVKVLFAKITPATVLILDTIKSSTIRQVLPSSEISLPLVRLLRSDKVTETLSTICPYLESPLIIEKLTAALMTHCQIYKIPAISLLSLEEQTVIGPATLYGFEEILHRISQNSLPSLKEFTTFGKRVHTNKGGIYTSLLLSIKSNKHSTLFL